MGTLSCKEARLLTQAATELDPALTGDLRTHLEVCPACRSIASREATLDDVIRRSLAGAGNVSVARDVRVTLQNRHRSARWGRLRIWPVLAAVPLACVLIVGMLLSPHVLHRSDSTAPASAAWHPVRPNIGYPIAVDPSRSGHVLAGAWGQVYESWNAGASWRALAPLPPHLVVRALAIDGVHPDTYLVATKHSVYRSVDAGRHWRLVIDSLKGAMNMFVLQNPSRPSEYYLGPGILWKSTDSGERWLPAGTGRIFAPDGIQALTFAGDALYTGIWGGGVAVSRDGGATWQHRATGLDPRVMDVEVGPGGTLWAATPSGAFRSTNGGRIWNPVSLPSRLFTTSVLPLGRTILVAGDGAVYRSTDGGHTWSFAMDGLPLDPYVFGLSADPRDPRRIYASLDSDGVFRSDNGGKTWVSIDAGIPMHLAFTPSHLVLFRRDGALWITNSAGSDPGVLTVEQDVRHAAAAPDGGGVAYIAGNGTHWAVREVGAGGSAPRTLASGTGRSPRRLFWSPNAAALAIDARREVLITNTSQPTHWRLAAGERVLGWTGPRTLATWNTHTHTLALRGTSGQTLRTGVLRLRDPEISAGGTQIAGIDSGNLVIGRLLAPPTVRVPVPASCRLSGWSDAGTILLRCGASYVVYSPSGRRSATLPAASVQFLSGSSDLIEARGGALWHVTASGHATEIVRNASQVTP